MYTPNQESTRSAHTECAAIVVTYEPNPKLFEKQMKALCNQLGLVIVVDNHSGPSFRKNLAVTEQAHEYVKIVLLDRNYGIAYAQNRGIDLASRSGRKYILFLDHDSVPAPGMVTHLYNAAESLQRSGSRIGAVGARLIDPRSGKENGFYSMRRWRWKRLRCRNGYSGIVACDYLNSSGTLHPMGAIARVGKFDESLFVDHVDSDWCMRARALGYEVYGVCPAILYHYMGNYVIKYWLFGWRYMPHRSPERHYYIVRNALWLYRRKHTPFFWKINNSIKIALTLLYFGLFDIQKRRQLRMILKGLWDGVVDPGRQQKTTDS